MPTKNKHEKTDKKKNEIDIHDRDKQLESAENYLDAFKDVPPQTKQLIKDFVRYKQQGDAPSILRAVKFYRNLPKLLAPLPKDLRKTQAKDIERLFKILFAKDVSPHTKRDWMELLKVFFKWLLGDDLEMRKLFKNVPAPKAKTLKLRTVDLLGWEECMAMSRATKSLRDAAFIQCLWDGGFRLEELMSMHTGDVEPVMNGRGVVLHVRRSKTADGIRAVAIPLAAGALLQYISHEHPSKQDKESPLFQRKYRGEYTALTDRWANKLLQEAGKRARITGKRLNPHSFRKASVSYYSQHLNDSQLKARYGWVMDTKVLRTYVGRNEEAANLQVFAAAGLVEEKAKPFANGNKCWQCGQENPSGWHECVSCGRTLDPNEASVELENLSKLEKEWVEVRAQYGLEAKSVLKSMAELFLRLERDKKAGENPA